MAPGHNGPYRDTETPVRNTSHWLITFVKACEIAGGSRYRHAAQRAASYLRLREARPMGATFWHRKNPNKDFCNGLVGQAWTIEALVAGGTALDMPELISLAEEVFLLHPFDETAALWRRVGVDGAYLSVDLTFNHQLWFAAAGGLLAPHASGEVGERVGRFMSRADRHMGVYRSGLIRHPLNAPRNRGSRLKAVARSVRRPADVRRQLAHKAVGYHAFNLYAFALLASRFPEHPFWTSRPFLRAVRYLDRREFVQGLERNPFGYPYNPPGFEVAYALHSFGEERRDDAASAIGTWVARQIERCYDPGSGLMRRGTDDPKTLAARLYEAVRLPDVAIDI